MRLLTGILRNVAILALAFTLALPGDAAARDMDCDWYEGYQVTCVSCTQTPGSCGMHEVCGFVACVWEYSPPESGEYCEFHAGAPCVT